MVSDHEQRRQQKDRYQPRPLLGGRVPDLRRRPDFCSRLEVLAYGSKAAQHYDAIRTALEKHGTPIGVNELPIAAHARSEGLTLVSDDTREFERVDGLLLANWAVGDAA